MTFKCCKTQWLMSARYYVQLRLALVYFQSQYNNLHTRMKATMLFPSPTPLKASHFASAPSTLATHLFCVVKVTFSVEKIVETHTDACSCPEKTSLEGLLGILSAVFNLSRLCVASSTKFLFAQPLTSSRLWIAVHTRAFGLTVI